MILHAQRSISRHRSCDRTTGWAKTWHPCHPNRAPSNIRVFSVVRSCIIFAICVYSRIIFVK